MTAGCCENGFDLGGEDQTAAGDGVVERLYADAIARKDEAAFVLVPQRDCEVAFELVNEVEAALFVKVDDGFRVGAGAIAVAALDKPGPQRSWL